MNYQINFKKPVHVHFIGIGGISMSGLAEILLKEGFIVTGSDSRESDLTKRLARLGALIYYGQHPENISDFTQVVIYTAAVKPDNPEFQEAMRRNLPILPRAELLGQLMNNYSFSVGISGTHGKTTTTSMLAEILLHADFNPTISVGGILKRINGNIHVGDSSYFITEACEYANSFLSFYPRIGVILNIAADHLDFFKDLDDIRHSFRQYASHIPPDGVLIINHSIEHLSAIVENLSCRVVTFGLSTDADYSASNIQYDAFACASFNLMERGSVITRIRLKTVGEHNILNALAAIAAAMEMQTPLSSIKDALFTYSGADRRFQIKGKFHGCTVIDDYAHHPDEIRATLSAARNYPHQKLWCVFQPHTYTRTNALLKEFAKSLALSDAIVLADIYAAREVNISGISSLHLLSELEELGKEVYHFSTFSEIEKFLSTNCINGDLLITMGAGDIVNVGEALVSQ